MILNRFPAFTISDAGLLRKLWFLLVSRWMEIAAVTVALVLLVAFGIARVRVIGRDPVQRQIENRRRKKKRGVSPIWDRDLLRD
jgi:hypothetical protein